MMCDIWIGMNLRIMKMLHIIMKILCTITKLLHFIWYVKYKFVRYFYIHSCCLNKLLLQLLGLGTPNLDTTTAVCLSSAPKVALTLWTNQSPKMTDFVDQSVHVSEWLCTSINRSQRLTIIQKAAPLGMKVSHCGWLTNEQSQSSIETYFCWQRGPLISPYMRNHMRLN